MMKRMIQVAAVLLICGKVMASGEMIINEFNAVGSEKYLNGDSYSASNEEDGWLADPNLWGEKITGTLPNGRIQGNLGDWIELVVTQDHLEIRGWQIRWAETGATEANGTDIWFGSGSVEQGILTFSDADVWSNLRAGTIIIITEESTIYVDTTNGNLTYNVAPRNAEAVIDLSTDTSFDPSIDDWWINVNTSTEDGQSEPLITSVHNVLEHESWDWGCGNDNWQAYIYDPSTEVVVWGPVGEALGAANWGGSGINSRETARLETDPSATVTGADFEDANTSYFGMANRWGTPENTQDFTSLRAWYQPPADCQAAITMGFGSPFDFNSDCYVDLADFAMFAENWLYCMDPGDSNCQKPWMQ